MADANEMVGDSFPAEIRDQRDKLPAGDIVFRIDDVQEGMAGREGDEVLAIVASLTAIEPQQAAGIEHEEMFWIGQRETDKAVTDGKAQADREGLLAATWQYRAARLKMFASKAGIDIQGKNRALAYSELKGRTVLGLVEHEIDKKNPQYTNARVKSWWAVGERTPQVADATEKPQPTAGPRPAAATAPRPMAAQAPVKPMPRRLGAR